MRLKILLLTVSMALSCLSISYAAEKITLSTFYPAPYGDYDELTATSLGVDDPSTNGVGEVFTTTNPGELIVEGSVGIGTTTPNEKLEVNGGIKMGNSIGTNSGTMRWTGSEYEGYYPGTGWQALGGGGGGGVSYTYYCFANNSFGTPVCANAGGSQGYCPSGYTQELALGSWGSCRETSGGGDYLLPPGGSCGTGYSSHVVGSAYVCSQ